MEQPKEEEEEVQGHFMAFPVLVNLVSGEINKVSIQVNTPLGQNICILFYFQAFCKFLSL